MKERSKRKKKENVPKWEVITNLKKNKSQLHKKMQKRMKKKTKKILQPQRRMQNLTVKQQENSPKPSNSTRNS